MIIVKKNINSKNKKQTNQSQQRSNTPNTMIKLNALMCFIIWIKLLLVLKVTCELPSAEINLDSIKYLIKMFHCVDLENVIESGFESVASIRETKGKDIIYKMAQRGTFFWMWNQMWVYTAVFKDGNYIPQMYPYMIDGENDNCIAVINKNILKDRKNSLAILRYRHPTGGGYFHGDATLFVGNDKEMRDNYQKMLPKVEVYDRPTIDRYLEKEKQWIDKNISYDSIFQQAIDEVTIYGEILFYKNITKNYFLYVGKASECPLMKYATRSPTNSPTPDPTQRPTQLNTNKRAKNKQNKI